MTPYTITKTTKLSRGLKSEQNRSDFGQSENKTSKLSDFGALLFMNKKVGNKLQKSRKMLFDNFGLDCFIMNVSCKKLG